MKSYWLCIVFLIGISGSYDMTAQVCSVGKKPSLKAPGCFAPKRIRSRKEGKRSKGALVGAKGKKGRTPDRDAEKQQKAAEKVAASEAKQLRKERKKRTSETKKLIKQKKREKEQATKSIIKEKDRERKERARIREEEAKLERESQRELDQLDRELRDLEKEVEEIDTELTNPEN